jgi:hypothetical protein
MKAEVGDLVVVASRKLLGQVRVGEVIAVGDCSGGGPYRVRWSDDGRETLFFPGPDAHVEHPSDKHPDAQAETVSDTQ